MKYFEETKKNGISPLSLHGSTFLLLLNIIISLPVSCEKSPLAMGGTRSDAAHKTQDTAGGTHFNPAATADTTMTLTCVEFPEGYDWQRDTANGSVPCRLVVIKDGQRTMEVECGYDRHVSSDPDMHRIVDGDLFTEFSTSGETFITKNGTGLLKWSGREMMLGFMVTGGDVYTLGQDRSGKGFSFRKNGKLIFASQTGVIMGGLNDSFRPTGALYQDSGHIYFSFYTVSLHGDLQYRTYFLVTDGKAEELTLGQGTEALYDMRVYEGVLYKAVKSKSIPIVPVLLKGEDSYAVGINGRANPVNVRIAVSGGNVYIVGDDVSMQDNPYACVWDRHGIRKMVYSNWVNFYLDGDSIAYVNCSRPGFVKGWSSGGPEQRMDKEYYFMSPACATFTEGTLFMALTPREGQPVIYDGKTMTQIDINGYLTSIHVTITQR